LSNNKIEYDVFVWSSDFEDHRGEGILARLFLKKLSVKSSKTFFIKTPGNSYLVNRGNINIVKKGLFKLNFYNKYIILFFGVFLIWVNLFKKKKIIYLNYLPLWNFLIFIFLPRKTIIGPITGGGFFFNVSFFQRIIRKFLFPLLYFLSLKIIDKKFENVVFSTNLLSKYVNRRRKKLFFFNFCLLSYQNLKYPKKKEIDFFIYYKINSTKNPFIFLTMQHMAFADYAIAAGENGRVELAKIQGRFNEIGFQSSSEEVLELASNLIPKIEKKKQEVLETKLREIDRAMGIFSKDKVYVASK
jgi:hypothetical protein